MMKHIRFIPIFFPLFFTAGILFAQSSSGSGWPTASQLVQYGISGLAQPAGTTGAGWRLQPNLYSYPAIVIWCNGSAAANTSAKNHFHEWTVIFDDSADEITDIGFEKDGARVNYRYDGKEIMIIAGVFANGTWPADSVWEHFGLKGLSKPPSSIIEWTDNDDGTLNVAFVTGGISAYSNLRSQLIAKNFRLSESDGDDSGNEQSQIFYNERIKTTAYLSRDGDKFHLEIRSF